MSEFVSLGLSPFECAGQIAAVFEKALCGAQPADALRYAALAGRLAAEYFKTNGELTLLFDLYGCFLLLLLLLLMLLMVVLMMVIIMLLLLLLLLLLFLLLGFLVLVGLLCW